LNFKGDLITCGADGFKRVRLPRHFGISVPRNDVTFRNDDFRRNDVIINTAGIISRTIKEKGKTKKVVEKDLSETEGSKLIVAV